MSKIVKIDLTNKKVTYEEIEISLESSGRALGIKILKKMVKSDIDYLSADNIIVLTPGLLTGTQAPSTGRLTIAAKKSGSFDVKTINVAGPLSQKIASLDIGAIAIMGNSESGSTVLHITDDCITLHDLNDLRYMTVSNTIKYIRNLWGEDTSAIGIGPAGEHVLSISSVFSTYDNGVPEYYCTRGKMGDIFGFKGLKAIAVTSRKLFRSPVKDEEAFRKGAKYLSRIIIDNPVCGGALPAYGSITLIQMMKQGIKFTMDFESVEDSKIRPNKSDNENHRMKINKNCAPNCVVGCLNRHKGYGEKAYSSPAESEAIAACKDIFGINDNEFVSKLNQRCFELGIDSIEFLFSCSMLLKAIGEEGTKKKLEELIRSIEELTSLGRILAATTEGIYELFAEKRDLAELVTCPAHTEESKFDLQLPYKVEGCEHLTDFEYLYGFISAVSNLGICLFTSFAMLESKDGIEALSELIKHKTGESIKPRDVILIPLKSLKVQRDWQQASIEVNISSYIPEFVKVLYRYFHKQ